MRFDSQFFVLAGKKLAPRAAKKGTETLAVVSITRPSTDIKKKMQPLAIIGVANRFPGSGNSPAEFWSNLINRKDCISEAKKDRWNARYFSSKGTILLSFE